MASPDKIFSVDVLPAPLIPRKPVQCSTHTVRENRPHPRTQRDSIPPPRVPKHSPLRTPKLRLRTATLGLVEVHGLWLPYTLRMLVRRTASSGLGVASATTSLSSSCVASGTTGSFNTFARHDGLLSTKSTAIAAQVSNTACMARYSSGLPVVSQWSAVLLRSGNTNFSTVRIASTTSPSPRQYPGRNR